MNPIKMLIQQIDNILDKKSNTIIIFDINNFNY